jgi:hypothetical protein
LEIFDMIRSVMHAIVVPAAAALFATVAALGMAADDTPDASVSFSGKAAAVGVATTWGHGTLHFHGRDYPFKLQGIGLLGVGGSSFEAIGEVYHLEKVEDFGGSYAAASAAAALDQGEYSTAMKNQRGVVMRIKSISKGVELKAAVEGVTVQLQ